LYNLKIGEPYPTECPLPLGIIITSDNTNETSLTNRRVCLGVLYFEFVAVIQIRDGKFKFIKSNNCPERFNTQPEA